MECRISLLLGRPPSEVRALPMSDLQQLGLYWSVEPWGPWRDNVHAGQIITAIYEASLKKLRRPPSWKDFMLRPREEKQAENRGSLLSALRMMARRKPK